jgi:hypothetical protein
MIELSLHRFARNEHAPRSDASPASSAMDAGRPSLGSRLCERLVRPKLAAKRKSPVRVFSSTGDSLGRNKPRRSGLRPRPPPLLTHLKKVTKKPVSETRSRGLKPLLQRHSEG